MQIVRLSSDDYEAARQIVAWLAYPTDDAQRSRAEIALQWLTIRSQGGVAYYPDSKKAVAKSTIESRMMRIDARFFKAVHCGQVASMGVIESGKEVAPWPIDWSSKIADPLDIALRPKIDGGQSNREVRKDVIKAHWRPFRTVLHLAAAMNGTLASNRKNISPQGPLLDLITEPHWVDGLLASASDLKRFSNPKLRHFGDGPDLVEFVR